MENLSIHSLFLAQIMGLYMIIISIIMVCRRNLYQSLIRSMQEPNISLFIWGVVGLIVGILLIDIHNIWLWKPRLLITLMSWYVLVKSVLWLSIPEKMIALTKKYSSPSLFYTRYIITAILGILLVAHGFHFFTDYNPLTN